MNDFCNIVTSGFSCEMVAILIGILLGSTILAIFIIWFNYALSNGGEE